MKKILLLLLMSVVVYMGYGMLQMEAATGWQEAQVVVRSGDTVWSIADHYATPGEDVRAVVYRIYKINKLENNKPIIPGQNLLVPLKPVAEL
ncbi:MAG: LysM domain-containing protein [Acidaminococcaceae bacterium]